MEGGGVHINTPYYLSVSAGCSYFELKKNKSRVTPSFMNWSGIGSVITCRYLFFIIIFNKRTF